MKKTKKLVSLLLAVVMILTVIPIATMSVDAANEEGAVSSVSPKRQKVVNYMREMATIKWVAGESFSTLWSGESGSRVYWTKGVTYYGIPYSQQYTYKYVKSGKIDLDDFLTILERNNGKISCEIGRNDCSNTVCSAWRYIDNNITAETTKGLAPGKGEIVAVGNYVYYSSGTSPKLTTCKNNGTQIMYAAYDCLQAGDAVCKNGHIMLVVSVDIDSQKVKVIHQSGSAKHYDPSSKKTTSGSKNSSWGVEESFSYSYLFNNGFIPITCKALANDRPYVDIGDNFYATITNKNNGKPIENQNDNVVLGSTEPNDRNVWKFYRNSDLSYNIVNVYNWKALDLESYGDTNGTNIKCYENTNVSAQRWFIMKAEGGFALVPKCSENGAMDLEDNNPETGTNIQFWTYNGTSAQIFNINKIDDIRNYLSKDLGDDFYGVILNKNYNKPIENRYGNVVLGTENHSECQVWHFIKNDDSTYNIVSLFDSKALDVSSYGNTNGTNIKVYENSNNDAQRWYLNEAWGGYTLSPKSSPDGVMDLYDNNPEDGTNIQFWEYNGTSAQIYTIEKLEDMHGYLSSDIGDEFYGYIKYSAAGLRLANFDGNVVANTPEEMPNQIWKFERQSDNSYLIRSCLDDTCIDSENGEFEDGNNVQTYPDNGTRAQRWYFIKHSESENKYTIKSQLANSLIDVEDSSFESGTNVHLWHPNDTNAQIFEIEVCDEETVDRVINSLTDYDDFFYATISNPASSLQVTNINQNAVVDNSEIKANKLWRFEQQQDYSYIITSFIDGKCLDAENGKYTNGTNVQTYSDNATIAQRWYLIKKSNNQCMIKSGLGNAALNIEISQGTARSGDNIGLSVPNGSDAQGFGINVIENINEYLATDIGTGFFASVSNYDTGYKLTNSDENVVLNAENESIPRTDQTWKFERQDDNSYLIRCISNGKCLDAANANDFDGNNVQVYEDNSTIAQRWIVVKTGNDQYLIKSVIGETVLDAYTQAGEVFDGTNIQVYRPNGTIAQIFKINKMPLSSISIEKMPNKTTYYIGKPLDTTGLQLELNYGDGLTDVISDGFTVDGFDSSTVGISTVTVTYQGKTTTFDVSIIEKPINLGDANLDGIISIRDVTAIQRHVAEFAMFNDEQLAAADTNGDGVVTIDDATHLQRYLAEFDVQLG